MESNPSCDDVAREDAGDGFTSSRGGVSQEILPGNDSTGSDENASVVLTGTSVALSCVSIAELW